MNTVEIRNAIELDLRLSPSRTVIYLEGKTDIDFLFALLGLPTPTKDPSGYVIHQEILVKACDKGSGATAVKAHIVVGAGISPTQGKIIGVIDGDGLPLNSLSARYDPPFAGPLFAWKAYCIENLLVKTGWPGTWGTEPNWQVELASYGPYVALNRVGLEVRAILKELGLEKYSNPILGDSLRSVADVTAALAAGKDRLLSFDVEQRYVDGVTAFDEALRRSLDEAHALLNGKWLVRHMAPTLTKRDPDQCRYDWIDHARSTGGLPEVREWWERVTGLPP